MHRRCQDRIRGYLTKAVEQIKSSDIFTTDRRARQHLLRAIAFFKLQLKEDHYYGHYFDRSKISTGNSNEVKNNKNDNDKDNNENSSDEIDDSGFFQCYEHCPCKLRNFDYFNLFEIEESDQIDARRMQQENDNEIESYYKVIPGKERKLITLCDHKGEFKCDGVWNKDKCTYDGKHKINPYRSKEELILFSTWNLDHRYDVTFLIKNYIYDYFY